MEEGGVTTTSKARPPSLSLVHLRIGWWNG